MTSTRDYAAPGYLAKIKIELQARERDGATRLTMDGSRQSFDGANERQTKKRRHFAPVLGVGGTTQRKRRRRRTGAKDEKKMSRWRRDGAEKEQQQPVTSRSKEGKSDGGGGRKERCAALARLGMFALGPGSAIWRCLVTLLGDWACCSVLEAVSAACKQTRKNQHHSPDG